MGSHSLPGPASASYLSQLRRDHRHALHIQLVG
jgi:hypothetical protein